MARLAVGTAQFGLDYGIQGRKKVPPEEIERILSLASKRGACLIDTASAYGDSEKSLGEALPSLPGRFSIVTKLGACAPSDVEGLLKASLGRLKAKSVYGCLFHDAKALLERTELFQSLEACREKGLCEKAGVSIYRPEDWELLREKGVSPQLVQLPYNLFDRRFERLLGRMKGSGVEVHVRSVFLQGLFAMDPVSLPAYFDSAKPRLLELRKIADELGVSPGELALRFVAGDASVDWIVAGMVSSEELEENCKLLEKGPLPPGAQARLEGLKLDDERITLPFNWPKTAQR